MFEKLLYVILAVGIIADAAFIAMDSGDITFSMGCFGCVLAGSIVGLLDLFVSLDLLLWLASILYVAGVGFHLYAALPSISDLWNHVNFIGGNQPLAIAFGSIFIVIMLFLLSANFVVERKTER